MQTYSEYSPPVHEGYHENILHFVERDSTRLVRSEKTPTGTGANSNLPRSENSFLEWIKGETVGAIRSYKETIVNYDAVPITKRPDVSTVEWLREERKDIYGGSGGGKKERNHLRSSSKGSLSGNSSKGSLNETAPNLLRKASRLTGESVVERNRLLKEDAKRRRKLSVPNGKEMQNQGNAVKSPRPTPNILVDSPIQQGVVMENTTTIEKVLKSRSVESDCVANKTTRQMSQEPPHPTTETDNHDNASLNSKRQIPRISLTSITKPNTNDTSEGASPEFCEDLAKTAVSDLGSLSSRSTSTSIAGSAREARSQFLDLKRRGSIGILSPRSTKGSTSDSADSSPFVSPHTSEEDISQIGKVNKLSPWAKLSEAVKSDDSPLQSGPNPRRRMSLQVVTCLAAEQAFQKRRNSTSVFSGIFPFSGKESDEENSSKPAKDDGRQNYRQETEVWKIRHGRAYECFDKDDDDTERRTPPLEVKLYGPPQFLAPIHSQNVFQPRSKDKDDEAERTRKQMQKSSITEDDMERLKMTRYLRNFDADTVPTYIPSNNSSRRGSYTDD